MSEAVNTPDLNAILGGLLSNPAALSGMMNIIGGLRQPPAVTEQAPTPEVKADGGDAPAIPAGLNLNALAPLLSSIGKPPPSQKQEDFTPDPLKRRRCLLESIRPYLSPSRCDTLNLLLRILDILSLLSPKK